MTINVNLLYIIGMESTTQARHAPLAQLMLFRFRWFDKSIRATLADRGFYEHTPAQALVFAYIDPGGTRSMELARRIGVSRQAIHKTVGELEALGFVTLEPDPDKGSAKLVTLTAGEGRDQLVLILRKTPASP